MRHIEDRTAVHELLDAVLDFIDETGENATVMFTLGTNGWIVHAADSGGADYEWKLSEARTVYEPIEPNIVGRIKDRLKEIADTNQND